MELAWVRRHGALLAILGLASTLRCTNLAHNPPGFFCDEADIANNAYQLLHTGRDTHEAVFPVFFQALGDYKNPVAIYSSIPTLIAFGNTEVGVRMMGAIYGILAVLAIFLLVSELFDRKAGTWAALMLAAAPWNTHLSRIGMEFSPVMFWVTFMLFAMVRGLRERRWYYIGCAALIPATLSYYTPWIYLPILLPLLILIHWPAVREKWLPRRWFWVASIVATLTLLALIAPSIQSGVFFGRWHSVQQSLSWREVWLAYRNHFSMSFLFFDGDAGFQGTQVLRHSIYGMGELYLFQLPFILAAPFAWIFWPERRRGLLTLLATLAVYPLGTVFTAQNPYATRSNLGAIAFCALTGVGIRLALRMREKGVVRYLLQGTIAVSLCFSLFQFHKYSQAYDRVASGGDGWQYGARQAYEYFSARRKRYDSLRLTHQFNAGEALRDFYRRIIPCENCGLHPNPIAVDSAAHELFAMRIDDVYLALNRYPNLNYFEQTRIYSPSGLPELLIGTFSELPLPAAGPASPIPGARELASH